MKNRPRSYKEGSALLLEVYQCIG